MKEWIHKWLMAIFAALIAFFAGFCIATIKTLNWVIVTGKEHFGLNITVDSAEIAGAIFRYMHQIG